MTYRTAIDNFDAIPKLEGSDSIVGNATSQLRSEHPLLRQETVDGPRAIPREGDHRTLRQSYYTDARSNFSDPEQRSRAATASDVAISRRFHCSSAPPRSMASTARSGRTMTDDGADSDRSAPMPAGRRNASRWWPAGALRFRAPTI